MSTIKNLASQTAVYGFSHIAGRLLNYMLTPFYVRVFIPEEYGRITQMYAFTSFLMVLFTYGMETGFFRFSEKRVDKEVVYNTAFISLLISSCVFFIIFAAFSDWISYTIEIPDHPEYVIWFALIICCDTLTTLPFARLRQQNKALRFAFFKFLSILLVIFFNFFFLFFCPYILRTSHGGIIYEIAQLVYDPSIGVGYVFISNLLQSIITLLFLLPQILEVKFKFDKELWKEMIRYSMPLLVVGLAAMVNENIDKLLIVYLRPDSTALYESGIYGACYKVAILMTLFIQAFRFAAEPFFFSHAGKTDSRRAYAVVLKYFVIVCSLIFLWVMMNMSWIKNFLDERFFGGLHVVPILLMANLFLGIYYNLSVWYKLVDKTVAAAWISVGGAVLTIVLNVLLIPRFGYTGAAWATLICYFSICVASYMQGKKHFPIDYQLGRIAAYILASLILYLLVEYLDPNLLQFDRGRLALNNLLVLLYAAVVYFIERPRKTLYS